MSNVSLVIFLWKLTDHAINIHDRCVENRTHRLNNSTGKLCPNTEVVFFPLWTIRLQRCNRVYTWNMESITF